MFFIAFKVWITLNLWFYTANEKLCKYDISFDDRYKNCDKLIQSNTLGQHTKNWDCPGKIGTVWMFAKLNDNKHD